MIGQTGGSGAPRRGRVVRRAMLALLLLTVSGGTMIWWRMQRRAADALRAGADGALPTDSTARAPTGQRITVRVVNGSQRRGLARRATFVLRDFGYDVVEYDGQGGTPRPSTDIIVHTGKRDAAERLQRALGAGRVIERADTSRYVDLTVVLGRDWRPPAQPLRP